MRIQFIYLVTLSISANYLFAQSEVSNPIIFKKETIHSLGNGQFIHLIKDYKIINGVESILRDSSTKINQSETAKYDSLFNLIEGPQYNYPGIDTGKSGWLLSDTLTSFSQKIPVTFKLDKIKYPVGYLIIPDIEVILPINFTKDGVSFIEYVPKGHKAKVVVMDRINRQDTIAKTFFITGLQTLVELKAHPASELEMEKELAEFNN
jgi:hypothetical protein